MKHDLREQLIFKGLDKPKSYKKTVLGSTPIDWQVLPFSEAIEIVSGQVDPKEEQYATLIQIGPEHIEPGTGRILAWQTSRELGLTSGKYLFSKEHVLYSKIRPYFKKVANPDCVGLCSADVYALKSVDGLVDKKFLFHYLLTDKFTTALLAFQNRTGMPKVNREELGSMHIPIPPADTRRFRAVLDDIDEKVEQFINTLNSSKLVLNALINQLFSPEPVVVARGYNLGVWFRAIHFPKPDHTRYQSSAELGWRNCAAAFNFSICFVSRSSSGSALLVNSNSFSAFLMRVIRLMGSIGSPGAGSG